MSDFFKPLRRKVGAVTLVMAAVFMGAWNRSLSTGDTLRTQHLMLLSMNGYLCWCRIEPNPAWPSGWESWTLDPVEDDHWPMWGIDETGIFVAHGLIAISLTILSAALLLWPQRRPKPSPN